MQEKMQNAILKFTRFFHTGFNSKLYDNNIS